MAKKKAEKKSTDATTSHPLGCRVAGEQPKPKPSKAKKKK